MPRFVIANEEQDSEESSTEGESEAEEQEGSADGDSSDEEEDLAGPSNAAEDLEAVPENGSTPGKGVKKGKISLSLGKNKDLVCGKGGHCAGFVGSVYMDCPNKPCYLCKKPGHTTMTCPYRMAPEHECKHAASSDSQGILQHIFDRRRDGKQREINFPIPNYQVDAAVLKLHSRRCTCLQFHPAKDNLVLSGDKSGQVAVWDYMKVYERTVWKMNTVMTNNLSFLPGGEGMTCCSSSSDGTIKIFDLEVGIGRTALNLNPGGWIHGVSNEKNWNMIYGLDVNQSRGIITGGDSQGNIHFVDARSEKHIGSFQLHKKGNKVNSIQYSPVDPNLMLSGSNDWTSRLHDIRNLHSASSLPASAKGKEVAGGPTELARMAHPKVVNSAYFSPITGRKILTTCIDNRIRVWDYLLTADKPADREIVHSHDFNRYLTPFRAEWDPKDLNERLFVCGRYISEDFGGQALHPIDIMDAQTGLLMLQLKDPNLATITPVNKIHPRLDLILSGSSKSLYAWRPVPEEEEEEGLGLRSDKQDANGGLKGSANYVFYDAELGADADKKKRKRKSDAKGGDGSDDDMPGKPPKTKGKAAKSKAKIVETPQEGKTSKTKGSKKEKDNDKDSSRKKPKK